MQPSLSVGSQARNTRRASPDTLLLFCVRWKELVCLLQTMASENEDPQSRAAVLKRQLRELSRELQQLEGAGAGVDEGAVVECCALCSSSSTSLSSRLSLLDSKPALHPTPAVEEEAAPRVVKRGNALSWDDFFMSMAFLAAQRSKDPSTQVGACIVTPDYRIVGIGYNGFPRGCSDDELPWARQAESELDTKYPYVCHAEMNAILNKNSADVKGCTIYVGLFPCCECAKMIIQSGISAVVFLSDKYHTTNSMIASRKMLNMARVTLRQHVPALAKVELDFSAMAPPPAAAAEE